MLATWRLIQDEAGEAAWNMAVDEAILESVIAGEQPPTVRFYRWATPSVSIGRFQQKERVLNIPLCEERQIQVVRRLTGGKAVLHGRDLTLCVVAPLRCFAPARSVLEVHLHLVQALAKGLQLLGIETRPVTRTDLRALRGTHAGCFEHTLPGDLTTADGVKVVGGAQYRRAEVVMEQISIPAGPLPPALRGCLQPWREPPPSPLAAFTQQELIRCFSEGFASQLAIRWQVGIISESEIQRAHRLLREYL